MAPVRSVGDIYYTLTPHKPPTTERTDNNKNHLRQQSSTAMSPRFLERMQIQAAMQTKWNSNPLPGPPAYQYVDPETTPENVPTHQTCPPPAYIENSHDDSGLGISFQSFPQGSTVLVIGAYTRQGMRIIDRLLQHQFSVRGIVINAREFVQTAKYFEAIHGPDRYQPSIISDPTAEGAFDAVAKTCSGVVYVTNRSSPITGSSVETLARVMSVLGSAMREADMTRFMYCYPAAATDEFSQSMVERTVSPAQDESAPAHPPSYESTQNEQNRPENVPFSVELAIRNWIGSNQPGFSLDISKLSIRVFVQTFTC
jgi:hypothetical protein